MNDQELAGERRLARARHDLVDAQEREEGAARQAAGEQRADDARRLAVGVGLPGVHRREAHLRAVADEQQDERGVQPGPREAAARLRARSSNSSDGSQPPT